MQHVCLEGKAGEGWLLIFNITSLSGDRGVARHCGCRPRSPSVRKIAQSRATAVSRTFVMRKHIQIILLHITRPMTATCGPLAQNCATHLETASTERAVVAFIEICA